MSRNWHANHTDRGISIGEGMSFARKVYLNNPTERKWYKHSYVLWFGESGATYIHCYANSLEDALEECGAWLADHAPGHIMPFGSDEHTELLKEACQDAGVEFNPDKFYGVIDSDADEILQSAEADLTYTESGFITSYEWGVSMEDPTTESLYSFISGE
jgi:hypothetical protein